jgi:PAS domain S-box-containing protein
MAASTYSKGTGVASRVIPPAESDASVVAAVSKSAYNALVLLKDQTTESTRWVVCVFLIEFFQLFSFAFVSHIDSPLVWHEATIVDRFASVFGISWIIEVIRDGSDALFFVCLTFSLLIMSGFFLLSYLIYTTGECLYTTPVKLLRMAINTATGILYIPILSVFVATASISFKGTFSHSQSIPLATISICFAMAWILLAALRESTMYETRPITTRPLARPHSKVQLSYLLVRTVITVMFSIVLSSNVILLTTLIVCGIITMCTFCWYLPFYNFALSTYQGVLSAMFCWTTICAMIAETHDSDNNSAAALLLYMATPLVVLCAIMYVRSRRLSLLKLPIKEITDVYDLELKGRFYLQETADQIRFEMEQSGKGLAITDEAADDMDTLLTEEDYQCVDDWYRFAVRKKFNQSSMAYVLWGIFHLGYDENRQIAITQLSRASELSPRLDELFHIAVMRDEMADKLTTGCDTLRSYVRYQQHLKKARRYDQSASVAQGRFWGVLLEPHVDLHRLHKLGGEISQATKLAREHYEAMIDIDSSSPEDLRMYGSFLTRVVHDMYRGEQLLSRALELEASRAKTKHDNRVDNVDIFDDRNGVVTISGKVDSLGRILNMNPAACRIYGYTYDEIVGRNIDTLVPEPFSSNHDMYLRRYVDSGVGSVINHTRVLFAAHKSGNIVPVVVNVRPILGEDAGVEGFDDSIAFIGVLNEMQTEDNYLFVNEDGLVVQSTRGAITMFSELAANDHNVSIHDILDEEYGAIREQAMTATGASVMHDMDGDRYELRVWIDHIDLHGLEFDILRYRSKYCPEEVQYRDEVQTKDAPARSARSSMHNSPTTTTRSGRRFHTVSAANITDEKHSDMDYNENADAAEDEAHLRAIDSARSNPLMQDYMRNSMSLDGSNASEDDGTLTVAKRVKSKSRRRRTKRSKRRGDRDGDSDSSGDEVDMNEPTTPAIVITSEKSSSSLLGRKQMPGSAHTSSRPASPDMKPQQPNAAAGGQGTAGIQMASLGEQQDGGTLMGGMLDNIGDVGIAESTASSNMTATLDAVRHVITSTDAAKTSGLSAVRRFFIITTLLVVASVIASFAVGHSMLVVYKGTAEHTESSGLRWHKFFDITRTTRQLNLIAEGLSPTAAAPDLVTQLQALADSLQSTHDALYSEGTFGSATLDSLYFKPVIEVSELQGNVVAKRKVNMHRLVSMYASKARLFASLSLSQMTSSNEHVYFFQNNMFNHVFTALNQTMTGYVEVSADEAQTVEDVELAFMLTNLLTVLLVLVFAFRPSVKKVQQNKDDVLRLFLDVPRSAVKELELEVLERTRLVHEAAATQQELYHEDASESGDDISVAESDLQQIDEEDEEDSSYEQSDESDESNDDSGDSDEYDTDASEERDIEIGRQKAKRRQQPVNRPVVRAVPMTIGAGGANAAQGSGGKGSNVPGSRSMSKESGRKGSSSTSSDAARNANLILMLKIFTLFVLCFVYFVSMYVWSQSVLSQTESIAHEINWSSRRTIAQDTVMYHTREAFLARNTSDQAHAKQLGDLASANVLYINDGLLFGNSLMALPGSSGKQPDQDSLMFSDACLTFVDAAPPLSGCSAFSNGLMTHGLDAAYDEYLRLLQKARNTMNLTSYQNLYTPDTTLAYTLAETHLRRGADISVDLYFNSLKSLVDSYLTVRLWLMLTMTTVVLLLYFWFYAPLLDNLQQDTNRTRMMLLIIPLGIMENVKSIRAFIHKNADSI